jgi:hypothetical protein
MKRSEVFSDTGAGYLRRIEMSLSARVHFPAAPDLNGVYPVLLGVYPVLLGVYSVLRGVYSVLLFLLCFCKLSLYLDGNVILLVLYLVLFS